MKCKLFAKGEPSRRVRNLLIFLTIVVFIAFYLVGYNHPYSEDPDFIEPRLTSVLLIFILVVVGLAVAVAVWALATAYFKRSRGANAAYGVPAALISTLVAGMTVGIMLVSLFAGSATAVVANGKEYQDEPWLKAVNMFVITSVLLMVIAAAAVCFSTIWSHFIKRK